jgi:hypothetical protein
LTISLGTVSGGMLESSCTTVFRLSFSWMSARLAFLTHASAKVSALRWLQDRFQLKC